MAGKKESEPLVRVTMNLYESDYYVMQSVYETIGAQVAIRKIVHAHVLKLREKAEGLTDDEDTQRVRGNGPGEEEGDRP